MARLADRNCQTIVWVVFFKQTCSFNLSVDPSIQVSDFHDPVDGFWEDSSDYHHHQQQLLQQQTSKSPIADGRNAPIASSSEYGTTLAAPMASLLVVGELPPPPPRPRDVRPILYSVDVALLPWTNYTFRVAGRNALGVGPFGRSTERGACSTPPMKPYRNPTGTCSNLTSSRGHLNVLWQVGHHAIC